MPEVVPGVEVIVYVIPLDMFVQFWLMSYAVLVKFKVSDDNELLLESKVTTSPVSEAVWLPSYENFKLLIVVVAVEELSTVSTYCIVTFESTGFITKPGFKLVAIFCVTLFVVGS